MTEPLKVPFTEILKLIPGFFGIRLEEEPKYEVVETVGDVEIRRYAPALLAQVTIPGPHDEAIDEGFERLARYIFGDNHPAGSASLTSPANARKGKQDGERMAMTNPVYQADAVGAWTVAFFLSNELEREPPKPDDPSVALVRAPARTIAVVRYTGNNTDARRDEAKRKLLAALVEHPRWRLDEDVVWAQYDAPFVLPFVKRNEAQAAVVER